MLPAASPSPLNHGIGMNREWHHMRSPGNAIQVWSRFAPWTAYALTSVVLVSHKTFLHRFCEHVRALAVVLSIITEVFC